MRPDVKTEPEVLPSFLFQVSSRHALRNTEERNVRSKIR
jgi:hypothetical protein